MRRALQACAAAVLLTGPAAIAFFSGGFFEPARTAAGVAVWILVVLAAVVAPRVLPASWAGRLALLGLALLTAWTGASITWAPAADFAVDDFQRLLLYLGTLLAATAFLALPRARRLLEPALAAGVVVVIGFGLLGRLLPRLVELDRSGTAGGRLEQPLTYWNAVGALAALGLVLLIRLAGDPSRPRAGRGLAAAGAVPVAAGLYITFSRGALAACAIGLLALIALSPTRDQLRALGIALVTGAAAAAVAQALPGVRGLEGEVAARARDGLIMLGALAALSALAAAVTWRLTGRGAAQEPGPALVRRFGRRGPALAAIVLAVAALVALTAAEQSPKPAPGTADAARLRSLESSRYDYWEVAVAAFRDEPLIGTGSGGFRAEWLRERRIPERARDAHSLYLETPAELGLVGVAFLLLLLGGTAAAAARAVRRDPALAAGPVAALAVWAGHAAVDWDWEMPAVTLPALLLAGSLIGAAGRPAPGAGRPGARAEPPPAPALAASR